ncbi:MAG: hypothetical protein HC888_01850 [Candidatus Competibacteraceae bacterium]|nr:hypothetical protein [Candidatus Competibacteraceae bacterium]
MHKLFVSKNDEIKVDVYWAEIEDGRIVADIRPDSIHELYDGVINVNKNIFVFRRPSFQDTVRISRDVMTDGRSLGFNPWRQRYMRMTALLKSWDFKDDDGNEIKADADNINAIDPVIAEVAALGLERAVGSF